LIKVHQFSSLLKMLIYYNIKIINVKDYIKDKFPSIFNFYLSSIEELDQYENEFIDL